ncbi:ComEC/Rec2 family competence protein [Nanoarchaeota archaeon]
MRDFKIFFFKVGNGHCSYLEFPNGENAIVDLYVTDEDNHDNIINILKEANISRIDYLILTHPHRDHIQGLSKLKSFFNIGQFICSPVNFTPDPIYEDWKVYEQMRHKKYCENAYEITEDWHKVIGDTRIDCVAPLKKLLKEYPGYVNNNSLVLRINCRGHNIILPGDMEEFGWEYINNEKIKNSTLLLASHHGNKNGYHNKKTKVKNPSFIVISTGKKTEHDADDRYRDHAKKGLYTTRNGRIVAKIDNKHTLHIS